MIRPTKRLWQLKVFVHQDSSLIYLKIAKGWHMKNAIMPLTYLRLVDWIDNEYANHNVN